MSTGSRKNAKSSKARKTSTPTVSAGKETVIQDVPADATCGTGNTLFDLPAEIRNYIWTLVVVKDTLIPINPTRPFLKEDALLAVNRQVRSETMSIWYAENEFIIDGSSPAVKFLRSRNDQQLRSIRSLCISSEKSPQMKEAPRAWLDHLRKKVDTIMREFESRGLRTKALRFQILSSGELKWVDGETMQVVEVRGQADKDKRIRAGPRKGQKVPGHGDA